MRALVNIIMKSRVPETQVHFLTCSIQDSCNHCCSGKAVSITYYECVFVASGIQHAMRMRHIVICGLSDCTIFFHIISWTPRFSEKKVIEYKMCDLFPLQLLSETFLITDEFSKILWSVCIVLKYLLFLSDFNETWNFWINFRKNSNIKFRENSFSVSQALPCGRTDKWRDRQTDMPKVIIAFRNFANVPKNCNIIYTSVE
jgi:hypothetical protein